MQYMDMDIDMKIQLDTVHMCFGHHGLTWGCARWVQPTTNSRQKS